MSFSTASESSSPNPLHSSASQLFHQNYTSSLLSPYLQQREKFYSTSAWSHLIEDLGSTNTLYIGNLSFYTRESQIVEFFRGCGRIIQLIMGLNSQTKTPAGFCFIEFSNHREAENARLYLSGCKLDERVIRVDLDMKFEEGRQWGRSKTGGQIRDDFRSNYDSERGGWSSYALKMKEIRERHSKLQFNTFQPINYSNNIQEIGFDVNQPISSIEAARGGYMNAKRQRLEQQQQPPIRIAPTDVTYDDEPIETDNQNHNIARNTTQNNNEISYDDDEAEANATRPQYDNNNYSDHYAQEASYDDDDRQEHSAYDNDQPDAQQQQNNSYDDYIAFEQQERHQSQSNPDKHNSSSANNSASYDDDDQTGNDPNKANNNNNSNMDER